MGEITIRIERANEFEQEMAKRGWLEFDSAAKLELDMLSIQASS